VNEERLTAAASVLSRVTIVRVGFDAALVERRRGDLLYLVRPYAPLTSTANFRSYTAACFTDYDQRRLRAAVVRLALGGLNVILSNYTSPAFVALYEANEVREAGLRCHRDRARRAIIAKADGRWLDD